MIGASPSSPCTNASARSKKRAREDVLPEGEKSDTRHLDDLESHTGNISAQAVSTRNGEERQRGNRE